MTVNPLNILPLDHTIDLLDLHRLNPERYPYLLESVVHGTAQSRYDILFAFPGDSFELKPGDTHSFLDRLDDEWRRQRIAPEQTYSELPFRGGWFLYLGYELAGEIEPCLNQLPPFEAQLPTAMATRIPAAVIRDHETKSISLVAEAGYEQLLDEMAGDAARLSDPVDAAPKAPGIGRIEEDEAQRYLQGVERSREYIRDGDVFQVNLSRGWSVTVDETTSAGQLYDRLRRHNPAPFAALMHYGSAAVISSSPERLVQVDYNGRVSTRPIAGTRPRGEDDASDQHYSETLLAHPKERAEHVMLIDLERNDLGRVCEPGSVKVDELMVLESYAHVHHIVSNVTGRLRAEVSPGDVIRAVFPGGTITGCPKVRCMEIIAELEQTGRGPYTGSLGYLNRDGSLDLNILIRTMYLENNNLRFRTGAGIVIDSVPEHELKETRAKAKGLLRALGVAE